jgi:hypothetical protein
MRANDSTFGTVRIARDDRSDGGMCGPYHPDPIDRRHVEVEDEVVVALMAGWSFASAAS